MEFEWDTEKNILNYWKHGIRFNDVLGLFHQSAMSLDVSRAEEYECRTKIIGYVEAVAITVVFTQRAQTVRIISARQSSRKERKQLVTHMSDRKGAE